MTKKQNFRNSAVATNNFEPLYKNLYEIILTPPQAIISNPTWSNNSEYIIENAISISGLMVDKHPSTKTQKWKSVTRTFAGSKIDDTTVKFTINWLLNLNNDNENFVYNFLKEWSDLLFDSETGVMVLKKDYVSPAGVTVMEYNRVDEVYRKKVVRNVFPAEAIPTLDLDSNQDDIFDMKMSFIGEFYNNNYKNRLSGNPDGL